MNSSFKAFISLLILGLIGTGFYFGDVKAIDTYMEMEKLSLKKQISVKPDNIKQKQALMKPESIDMDKLTFFETLVDPLMRKFVGLNGSIILGPQEVANDKTSDFVSRDKKSSTPQPASMDAKETLSSEAQKQAESLESEFVLQVGSFHKVEGANLLKNNLGRKGYPVFVEKARMAGSDKALYRVFVGKFVDKRVAEKSAVSLKEIENLDPFYQPAQGTLEAK